MIAMTVSESARGRFVGGWQTMVSAWAAVCQADSILVYHCAARLPAVSVAFTDRNQGRNGVLAQESYAHPRFAY